MRLVLVLLVAVVAGAAAPALARAGTLPTCDSSSPHGGCTRTTAADGAIYDSFGDSSWEQIWISAGTTGFVGHDAVTGLTSNCLLLDGSLCGPGQKWTNTCNAAGDCTWNYADGSVSRSYANGDYDGSYIASWDGNKTYYYSYAKATNTRSSCSLDGTHCSPGKQWTEVCDAASPPNCDTTFSDGTFSHSKSNGDYENSYIASWDGDKTYYSSYTKATNTYTNCLLDGTTCSPGRRYTSTCDTASPPSCQTTYSDGTYWKTYSDGDYEGSYIASWDGNKTYYYSYAKATNTRSSCSLDGTHCSPGKRWTEVCDAASPPNCDTTYSDGTFYHSKSNGDYESSYIASWDGDKTYYSSYTKATRTYTNCLFDGTTCSPGRKYTSTCDTGSPPNCQTTYSDGTFWRSLSDGSYEGSSKSTDGTTYYYSYDAATRTTTPCLLDGTTCSPGPRWTQTCDASGACTSTFADGSSYFYKPDGTFESSYKSSDGTTYYDSYDASSGKGSNCTLDGTKCSPGKKTTFTRSCNNAGCRTTKDDGTFSANYKNGDSEGSFLLDDGTLGYYSWNSSASQGSNCLLDGTTCSAGGKRTYTRVCDASGNCTFTYSDGAYDKYYANGNSESKYLDNGVAQYWSWDDSTRTGSNCLLDGTTCSSGGKITWTCTNLTCHYVYADGSWYDQFVDGSYQGTAIDGTTTTYYSYDVTKSPALYSNCLLDGTTCSSPQKITWTCNSAGDCFYSYADGTFYNLYAKGDYEGSYLFSGATYYYSYRASTGATTGCLLDGSHCS